MARRGGRWTALAGAALLAMGLSGCIGGPDGPRPEARTVPAAAPDAAAGAGNVIGAGSVKLALIVPLTGPGASVGAALRNAAELAYDDFQKPNLQILVKDDRGTPEGAREAAQAAFAEGAEVVLGPLFAANVQAAGVVARGAGKPVIAFSTDAAVAARGVYLISFLPQSEVDRIVDEATANGRRSFAALIPETTYGNAVEAQFREAVARRGARLVGLERYAAGNPGPAVERLRGVIAGSGAQADALFVPDTPDGLVAVGPALTRVGFSPARVRPLGLALWNDPRVMAQPAFQGARFAAPDTAGFSSFAQRYQARFGTLPPRTASLGYDAVSLTAALVRQYGTQRFADATLTNPAGFSGLDGTFRFLPEGVSERTLAVYEIRNNAASVVSPAPKVLGPSGI
ncbi:extracellular ligand-binding receptor [Methylorubrum populi BJ001]|jgi:ABC-type branched-subunit amino acid transport system substrate-binding protein|uniref:Extracellular ligand-binding receptor n=1 Tax=Methylorubrum populi (strain ATCC BAA-705 / NCIMB 13946 / BJ001) TaxID=441620 RepID=B1ZJ76_METPB|nr:penicillin-binding protein activator [Methylorubrum populi]ACB78650.1 extracellular ligand-binding receptor [Methylorubrum populi BJ001]OAH20074.1 ethanolamine utilization protein EutM [Methylorubrum populi]PZP69943.1 MAG: penicillin-binding protein activator [Methylorubrum populi]